VSRVVVVVDIVVVVVVVVADVTVVFVTVIVVVAVIVVIVVFVAVVVVVFVVVAVVVVAVVMSCPELTLQAEQRGGGGPADGAAGRAVVGALVLGRDVPQPQGPGGQRGHPGGQRGRPPGAQHPVLEVPGDRGQRKA